MTNSADQRVLVVDDEESIRWVLKRGLEREGYDVSTATDGEEALKRFKAEPFPVVFLDIRMPGPSGFEVMEAMKATHPDVFVVIITAQATMENAILAMKQAHAMPLVPMRLAFRADDVFQGSDDHGR